jgi:hypothetical protein
VYSGIPAGTLIPTAALAIDSLFEFAAIEPAVYIDSDGKVLEYDEGGERHDAADVKSRFDENRQRAHLCRRFRVRTIIAEETLLLNESVSLPPV